MPTFHYELRFNSSTFFITLNYLKLQNIFPPISTDIFAAGLCGLFEAFVFVHGGHNAAADNGLMHCNRRTNTRHSDILTLVYAAPRICRLDTAIRV